MSESRSARTTIQVLWPAFGVAALANAIFFTLFDPHDLTLLGRPLDVSREATYTIGFLLLWLATALSSALTSWLVRGTREGRMEEEIGDGR